MKPRSKKLLPALALALLSVTAIAFALRNWNGPDANDFLVYFSIAKRMAEGKWSELYTWNDVYGMLRYSPISLSFFLPLSFLEFKSARLLWYVLMWGAYLLGFWRLYRLTGKNKALTALTFILCLRPFLSSLVEGQIIGLMFLGATLGLEGFVKNRAWLAGAGLLIPNSLKLGLGVLYPLFFAVRGKKFFGKVLVASLVTSLVMLGILLPFIKSASGDSLTTLGAMLRGWFSTLGSITDGNSDHYWWCSHYSSQAWNSALQRLFEAGWYPREWVRNTWLGTSFLALAGLMAYWWKFGKRHQKKALAPVDLWNLYSLGVLAFLILMPFTYRHTLTFLAIPILGLLQTPADNPAGGTIKRAALWFFFLTVSLPGSSVVGFTLFHWMQRVSLPFISMLFLTFVIFRSLPTTKKYAS